MSTFSDIRSFKTSEVLSKAFKDFFICYSKSINKLYNRTGSLFQAKFKKRIINKEEYLIRLILYIHNNPIRAGLVRNITDWEYSSYNKFINKIVKQEIYDFVMAYFSSLEKFIDFHKVYDSYQKERDYLFKNTEKKTSEVSDKL